MATDPQDDLDRGSENIRESTNRHAVPEETPDTRNTLETNAVTRAEAPEPESPTHAHRIEENMLPFGISPDGQGNHQPNAPHEIKASTLEKQRVDQILDEEEALRQDKHARKRG